MSLPSLITRGALAALIALAPWARAAVQVPAIVPAPRSVSVPASVPAMIPATVAATSATAFTAGPAPEVPGFGAPAAPDQLERARGGADRIVAQAALRGTVSGNSATNMVTGGNTIQSGSFAGASGIPIVIQNSGANVLIQNATVINLQFQ